MIIDGFDFVDDWWGFCRYTLWNAEYRVSLMRNFENSPSREEVESSVGVGDSMAGGGDCEGLIGEGSTKGLGCEDDVEETVPPFFGELSPEALRYIEGLKSDLATIEKVDYRPFFIEFVSSL